MNYYDELKTKADERCKPYFKTVSDLQQQLPKVTRRLEAERGNRDNLQGRLKKLDELSMESLSDQNSYEKYKVNMRKLNAELAVSEEIIGNITTKILPNAEGRLKDAEMNLGILLRQIVLETRKDADAKIDELLRQCIAEYDGFLSAAGRLFADFGQVFICSDESYCPSPWKAEEINAMRVRLGMIPNPEPTREEVFRHYMSPPESKSVTETPVSEPSPPDNVEPIVDEAPIPAAPDETPASELREVG